MMKFMDRWRRPVKQPALRAPTSLPPEVVATIAAARVRCSDRPDQDGNPIVKIRAAALGEWRWSGIDDAAERIHQMWPDLTAPLCVRAAQLLEATVGNVAMDALRLEAPRRKSWVFDW